MYVTRPLSLYRSSPQAIYESPNEGPNSGYLVISRQRVSPVSAEKIKELPLPQDKILYATYMDYESVITSHVLFIPVINQPLSSNRYYMISAERYDRGLAHECSGEEDVITNCWGQPFIASRRSRRLNPVDIYQQFKINVTRSTYNSCHFKSVALDGVVKNFLRQTCDIYFTASLKNKIPELSEDASGLNPTLRNNLPSFDFLIASEFIPPVVVGKWVCPFMFIREGEPKQQMKSPYYEMTLEQRWDSVFTSENTDGTDSVAMKVVVPTSVVKVSGKNVLQRGEGDGVLWFWIKDDQNRYTKVGLSLMIVERMMWEQDRVGWVERNEKQVIGEKVESFSKGGMRCSLWKRYGCYVLVESFVLKRMDGSSVLTYEFNHTQQMKCKWETS